MGNVCNWSTFSDNEIKNANSIDEIIEILNKKRENFEKEMNQIEDYLEDPSKKVELFNVEGIDKELVKKRIPYLKSINENYVKVNELLSENPNLPLYETKCYVDKIVSHYYQICDNDLSIDMKIFENFVKNQKSPS